MIIIFIDLLFHIENNFCCLPYKKSLTISIFVYSVYVTAKREDINGRWAIVDDVTWLPNHCSQWTAEGDSPSGPCFWTVLDETIAERDREIDCGHAQENVRKIEIQFCCRRTAMDLQMFIPAAIARTLNERLGIRQSAFDL